MSETPTSAFRAPKTPIQLLRNSQDHPTSLLVADLRTVLKDKRAKDNDWLMEKYRQLLKVVTGEDE